MLPWRISVLLVPLSTALLLGRLLAAPRLGPRGERWLLWACSLPALAAAGFGLHAAAQEHRSFAREPALPMMRHVANTRTRDALYVIPVDLERFRLETGARTFIDWKSHPYRDREVLEWFTRLTIARRFERAQGPAACGIADELRAGWRATHLVVPATRTLSCAGLALRYRDDRFLIYEWLEPVAAP